jgi:hypothetical protein
MLTHRLGLLSKPVSPDKLRAQAAKVRRAAGATARSFQTSAFRVQGRLGAADGCSAAKLQSWAQTAATTNALKGAERIRP